MSREVAGGFRASSRRDHRGSRSFRHHRLHRTGRLDEYGRILHSQAQHVQNAIEQCTRNLWVANTHHEGSQNAAGSPMTLVVVACAKQKLTVAAPASELYTSPLFALSWGWARDTGHQVAILSARHGVIRPEEVLEPYDTFLGSLGRAEVERLADHVRGQLSSMDSERIIVLGGSGYVDLVRRAAPAAEVIDPMHGLSLGHRLRWLKATRGGRWRDAVALEQMYTALREQAGGPLTPQNLPSLAQVLDGPIPSRGLYFFFEDSEKRSGRAELRVTRVGTHAVSRGAASTLRSRLRTHAGTAALAGSHRSSIFRLHVGGALLADDSSRVPTWGTGSGGTADAATRAVEAALERDVSARLRGMRVVLVSINDEPSAQSDRAYIERNAIGLISTVGHRLDPPSPVWLGNNSRRAEIQEHGMWNLDHLEYRSHPDFADVLRDYVRATDDAVGPSRAPADWWQPRATLF